jgi:hypothetical protein
MIAVSQFWHEFNFYGKTIGTAFTFLSVLTYLYKKLVSPVVKKVVNINDTVSSLALNHFPHLQNALASQEIQLKEIKTSVVEYGARLENTNKAVETLHQSFTNHIENESRKKRNAIRVNRATRVHARAPRDSR